jgi:hypothetical protein
MNLERTWTTGPANVFGFWARALNPSPTFWLAMFVASAFGTVLGDFWAEGLHLGLVLSFGTLVAITGLLIWGDCLKGQGQKPFTGSRSSFCAPARPMSEMGSSTSLGSALA